MAIAFRKQSATELAVIDVIHRLWQTKLKSIDFLDRWHRETKEAEIRAGLETQLIDERRHLRLLGEQLKRLGCQTMKRPDSWVARPFALVQAQTSDLLRLCVLHRGVKTFTLDRCGHLVPMVDESLARVLDHISMDEERHVRWADIRLARLLTREHMRDCNLLMGRIRSALDASWEHAWLPLTRLNLKSS